MRLTGLLWAVAAAAAHVFWDQTHQLGSHLRHGAEMSSTLSAKDGAGASITMHHEWQCRSGAGRAVTSRCHKATAAAAAAKWQDDWFVGSSMGCPESGC